MKSYWFCILFSVLFSCVYAQEEIAISGIVTDEAHYPIPDVVISINWSKKGLLSHNDGSFYISVKPTDTLVFKHVSFEPKAIAVGNLKKQDTIKVQLTERNVELGEVEVTNWGTWQDFKEKIKTMDADSIRDTDEYRLETMFGTKRRHPIKNPYFRATKVPSFSILDILNPFYVANILPQLIYTKTSNEQKIRRQVESEKIQEIAVENNQHRYTEEYVGKILNIEGNELHSFKIYCDYFINFCQNDYEMIQQIHSLYNEWKKIEDFQLPNDSIVKLSE